LNYSYPPLLYQRGEDDEEEDDMFDDDGEEEEEEENSQGCSEGDLIELPNFHDSDDDVDAVVDNLDDTNEHLLNKLQRAVDSNDKDNYKD